MWKKKNNPVEYYHEEFYSVITICQNISEKNIPLSEKLLRLNYISDMVKSDMVKNDLKYDRLSRLIQKQHRNIPSGYIIPVRYEQQDGSAFSILTNKTKDIYPSKNFIITEAWSLERLFKALSCMNDKDKEFVYIKGEHIAVYYTEIDLCYVYNGNHSITASNYFKNAGSFPANVCETSLLYPYVYSDGFNWLRTCDKSVLCTTWDYRIALLYEISRIKYNLSTTM